MVRRKSVDIATGREYRGVAQRIATGRREQISSAKSGTKSFEFLAGRKVRTKLLQKDGQGSKGCYRLARKVLSQGFG
tara:strand:+ start:385 stop:615 length:231 start_codon:yes stop_codon:yes gene_type:complete